MALVDGSRRQFKSEPYVIATVPMMIWQVSGTTNATGAITFTIPAGAFTTVYSVTATAVRDTVNPALACFALVRTYTTSSVVVQVFESKNTGVLLGGNIEGLELSTAATTVLLTVFGT